MLIWVLVVLFAGAFAFGCGDDDSSGGTDGNTDNETDADTDTDTEADIDTDVDTDTGAVTDTNIDTDTDTDVDTGTDDYWTDGYCPGGTTGDWIPASSDCQDIPPEGCCDNYGNAIMCSDDILYCNPCQDYCSWQETGYYWCTSTYNGEDPSGEFDIDCQPFPDINTDTDTYSDIEWLVNEDFDSYADGYGIATEGGHPWHCWNTVNNSYVSNNDFYTKPNYLRVSFLTDLVYVLDDFTAGVFQIDFYVAFPHEFNGGYALVNLLTDSSSTTSQAFIVRFEWWGTGEIEYESETFEFDYTQGTWLRCSHIVDLDNNTVSFEIDGQPIHQWPYSPSGSGQDHTLSGIRFWSYTGLDMVPEYRMDNLLIGKINWFFWVQLL